MKVAIIGRFQPLHKGHYHMIKKVFEEYGKENTVVVIGSINRHGFENPLSFEERKMMITSCFGDVKVYGLEDFESDEEWTRRFLEKFPDVNIVISGSNWVRRCLTPFVKVITPDFLEPEKYKGTNVRRLAISGGDWKSLVPECSRKILEELNFVERLKQLLRV